jgi:hypothetical protein
VNGSSARTTTQRDIEGWWLLNAAWYQIPGIPGTYRHVSPTMRLELTQAMTGAWEAAPDARLAMSPRSPVAVLDALLEERAGPETGPRPPGIPQETLRECSRSR